MENWIVVAGIFIESTVRGKVTIFGECYIRKIDFCTKNERWKKNEKIVFAQNRRCVEQNSKLKASIYFW